MFAKLKNATALQTFFVLIVMVLVFACLNPFFFSVQNLLNILLASSVIGVLSIGAALVIGGGGIDLSSGSMMACSIALASVVPCQEHAVLFLLISAVLGMLLGAVNGLLIARIKLPPFIVTLSMLSIARGLALVITDGRPIYGLSPGLRFIGQGEIAGIPFPVIIFVLVAIAAHTLLRFTAFGTHLLAIGDNTRAAQNAGVAVTRHTILLYTLSALLATIAGILFMGRVNAIDPSAGQMYELAAITAAIIGGSQLNGGRTSVVGAALGALVIGTLQNGMNIMAVASYYQQLAIGVVLILAMILNRRGRA